MFSSLGIEILEEIKNYWLPRGPQSHLSISISSRISLVSSLGIEILEEIPILGPQSKIEKKRENDLSKTMQGIAKWEHDFPKVL